MASEFEIQRIHRDRGALEAALRQAGAKFKNKAIGCLWHDDQNPSGSIYENEKGEWRFKCHSCGVVKDVLDVQAFMQGKSVDEVLRNLPCDEPAKQPKREPEKPARVFPTIEAILESLRHYWTVEDCYPYAHPDTGVVELVMVRLRGADGDKVVFPYRPQDGGYVCGAPPKPWPIFNRTAIRSADTVIVVEGEKCVKVLREVGLVATTSPLGSKNGDKADWSPLAGKTVYLWPDFDENGAKYIDAVCSMLEKLRPETPLNRIDVSGFELPKGGDIVDYLDQYGIAGDEKHNRKLVQDVLGVAVGTGPSGRVKKLICDTISGKRYSVPTPWPKFDGLTNALLPGTTFMICGDPGASKSFMLLQACRWWHKEDVPFALFQLEADEEGSHLMRALVQHTGRVEFLDWKWIRDNPEEANRIFEDNKEYLDDFGKNLWHPPESTISLADLTDWVRDRAKEGRRVIGIDPITAADTSSKRWDDDRKFILNCQRICTKASLVLVTHPKLGARNGKLGDEAGGAGYGRFVQTAISIQSHRPWKDVSVEANFGMLGSASVNRTIRITKARLGKGTGTEVACQFGNGMLFEEVGIISEKKSDVD